MLQAILFDLDGTLAHTDPIHFRVWQAILKPYGLTIDPIFYRQRFSGRLNPDIVADLLPHLSKSEGMRLSEAKEARFREVAAAQLQPLTGFARLLAWIQTQGLRTAVVTNAPRPNAEFMLRSLQLTQTFDRVIIADDLPRGKPDPLPYQTALHQLRVRPDQAVVFEDSPTGVQAAVATGIPTVGITTSHSAEDLYALGVDLAVADFTDKRLRQLGLQV